MGHICQFHPSSQENVPNSSSSSKGSSCTQHTGQPFFVKGTGSSVQFPCQTLKQSVVSAQIEPWANASFSPQCLIKVFKGCTYVHCIYFLLVHTLSVERYQFPLLVDSSVLSAKQWVHKVKQMVQSLE